MYQAGTNSRVTPARDSASASLSQLVSREKNMACCLLKDSLKTVPGRSVRQHSKATQDSSSGSSSWMQGIRVDDDGRKYGRIPLGGDPARHTIRTESRSTGMSSALDRCKTERDVPSRVRSSSLEPFSSDHSYFSSFSPQRAAFEHNAALFLAGGEGRNKDGQRSSTALPFFMAGGESRKKDGQRSSTTLPFFFSGGRDCSSM